MTTLTSVLNSLAGTTGLDATGAANDWAGTTGLALPSALYAKAVALGMSPPSHMDTQGMLNFLAGTTGLAPDGAAAALQLPLTMGNLAAWYDARYPAGFGGAIPADGTALAQWNDLSGNNRHATQVTGSARPLFRSANPNLLTYNQATVETDLTGLLNGVNCTIARSTSASKQGTASLAATSVAAGSTYAGISRGLNGIPVSPGHQITAMVSILAATVARSCYASIFWYDASGSFLSASNGPSSLDSTSAWTDYLVTGTAPATAAFMVVVGNISSTGAAGEVHYIDCLGLFPGTVSTWLPPVTLPNGLATVQFDGAAQTMAATIPAQSATALTAYFVGRPDFTPTTARQAWSATGSATANDGITAALAHSSNVGAVTVTSGNAQTTAAHVFSVVASASALQAFTDGTGGTAGAAASGTTGTTLNLGGAGSLWPGSLAAVLVYSAAHTTAQRQAVERWLGQVFNIAVA